MRLAATNRRASAVNWITLSHLYDLPMKTQLSKQISIAKHIIDGTVTIDSVDEFQGMLQIFPNDPALRRSYADLLTRKQASEAVTIKVLGSIVWSKEVYDENGKSIALGIRFEEMSPQMSGLLMVLANLLNTSS